MATACGAVGVLRTLHDASPESLEATVLECPAGMQRLLDILASAAESASEEASAGGGASEREPLRNAALELWEQLTRTNADMKTFLALAEGFEHLAVIVSAEDDCRGPIAKDCLAVALNVVAGGSYQAQGLLCQSGFLRALPPLFDLPMKESKVRLIRGNNALSTPGKVAMYFLHVYLTCLPLSLLYFMNSMIHLTYDDEIGTFQPKLSLNSFWLAVVRIPVHALVGSRDDASAATSGSEWDSDESAASSDDSDGYITISCSTEINYCRALYCTFAILSGRVLF